MAESAGLALGAIGLAGLFSSCIECLNLIQRGRSLSKDYRLLETKLSNQELRLRAWGKACGFVDSEAPGLRLNDSELEQQIRATLDCIKLLFSDSRELKKQYGLKLCKSKSPARPDDWSVIGPEPSVSTEARSKFSSLFRTTRADRSQPLLSAAQWAIEDKEKFSELVKHLKDFVDDLEALTRATEIPQRQRIIVDYEIESIPDVSTLEEIEMAREGDDDVVSDAASIRLERLRESSRTSTVMTNRSSIADSLVTLESYFSANSGLTVDSYTTALSRFSMDSFVSAMTRVSTDSGAISTLSIEELNELSLAGIRHVIRELLSSGIADSIRHPTAESTRYKLVVMGEAGPRKTSLLFLFIHKSLPEVFMPSVLEGYIVDVQVDSMSLELELWDTTGQEEYHRLRPLSYPDTNVLLVCFSVGSPEEQQQIKRKWAPEAKHFCPGVPLILVGIESAERKISLDIASERRQGLDLAGKVGALTYIQCNLEANKGVEDVLHAAAMAALLNAAPRKRGRWWRRRREIPPILESLNEA